MSSGILSQNELDQLIAESTKNLPVHHRAHVTGKHLERDILYIKIAGLALGTDDSAYVIDQVSRLTESITNHIVVDISDCVYLSSLAIGSLLKLACNRQKNNKLLVINGANATIKGVLSLLSLEKLLPISANCDEAVTMIYEYDDMTDPD